MLNLENGQKRGIYVLVTLDERQPAIGERPTVSIYRSFQSALKAMRSDMHEAMKYRGYALADFVIDDKMLFAKTKDDMMSWSMEMFEV